MTYSRRYGLLLSLFAFTGMAFGQFHEVGDGSAGPVKSSHVTAELQSETATIQPGGLATIALVLHLEPGWHVYWVNAGDSGEAPTVDWILPQGISVDEMQFPVPKRLPLGPLMDYGYEGTAVFPFNAHADAQIPATKSSLKAHVRWLVCREVCVPGKAFLGLNLRVSQDASGPSNALIATAVNEEPGPLPSGDSVDVSGNRDHLKLVVHTGVREASAEFYPFDEDALRNASDQIVQPRADGLQLSLERGDISDTLPTHLSGVLKLNGGRGYVFDVPVRASAAPETKSGASRGRLALALLLAFAGGLTLNLMPCVFPVLFLKALSLATTNSEEKHRQRLHGVAYALGILASFWSIVGVLLIVRSGGHQVGWGFQLQSPGFVAIMASLLFFMALSLAGQFDIGLSLTGKGDSLTRTHGYSGSFFTGVLATVVATPCTAPLMGAAIGYALSQPAATTFAIFSVLALGLALPYVLLTFVPGLARWMPRPGRWMDTLKQFTALPLLLTVVWLVWVYGQLYSFAPGAGADHIARLLVGLVLMALAGWALARWPAQRIGTAAAIVLLATSLAVSLVNPHVDPVQWQAFSPEAVEQARAEGRPVFVDFTAAWCLSCQVNERAVLHDRSVERELTARHYILLRADWTRYDPEITRQLASISRSGVPTYVIYPAGQNAQPQVLPELLTRTVVLDAIAKPGI